MALKCVVVRNEVGRIDPDRMHPRDLDILTLHAVRGARRYFEKPGVREEFEIWIEQQRAHGRYLDDQITQQV